MKILFEHKNSVSPKVSIVLLDWSCRESFHTLDYLADQTVPREQYEVLWIEYYQRRSPEIEAKLAECKRAGLPPVIDQWIVLNMAENLYYHKHLMYNVGILASKGEIVVICDSDAMMKPTFVESILKSFAQDPHIVLHLDEVRNVSQRFHPFKYPSFDDVLGEGCINWKDGKTTGVLDREDPVHTRNYGACMCARKDDLIAIGGADEYKDYLGHICGPYELTFRLINIGKREVWHQEEFLYHVWHPGTDGHNNYLGPHDGYNMSTTALALRQSGRLEPLIENPAVRRLRLRSSGVTRDLLFSEAISSSRIKTWKINFAQQKFSEWLGILSRGKDKLVKKVKSGKDLIRMPSSGRISSPRIPMPSFLRHFIFKGLIYLNLIGMSFKQAFLKGAVRQENRVMPKDPFLKVKLAFVFLGRMWKNNVYVFRACRQLIEEIMDTGARQVAVCGVNDATKIVRILLKERRVSVAGIYANSPEKLQNVGYPVKPLAAIRGYRGKVLVVSFLRVKEKVQKLQALGIDKNDILRLL